MKVIFVNQSCRIYFFCNKVGLNFNIFVNKAIKVSLFLIKNSFAHKFIYIYIYILMICISYFS